MFILGVNAYHGDASAALVSDGKLIAAAEEERFNREKHWAGLPAKAIGFCLEYAGIGIEQLDHIAINSDNRANRFRKVLYVSVHPASIGLALRRRKNRTGRQSLLDALANRYGKDVSRAQLHAVGHHRAHLASAFYPSGFDSAALFSVDGFGDFTSAAWGRGDGEHITVLGQVLFPHSLGIFYQAMTQFLGFHHYGDEYKVMGLASYGDPRYSAEFQKILNHDTDGNFRLDLKYFRHHRESLNWQWENGSPVWDNLFNPRLEQLLGPARKSESEITDRHRDIASTVQQTYEDVLFRKLRALHRESGERRLALAGGCAMNSVANGKIRSNTPFESVYVQPAAGDAGGAVGAALEVSVKLGINPSHTTLRNPYLGPQYSSEEITAELNGRRPELMASNCQIKEMKLQDLLTMVAEQLAQGAVIGWFQGRMEWGPRALGNRSIIADPRRDDIQELLNRKIKRRESFRPFAPSILADHVNEWFETDDSVPYMEKVYPIRIAKRALIPAVTHVDGSGRLQTVDRADNPRYYMLIREFFRISGVPVILNTSFNENEPIVCTPGQALDCFLRTKMDMLVLGEKCIVRRLHP